MSTIQGPNNLTLEEKRSLLRRALREKAAASHRDFPSSQGQRALWFLHQFNPDSAAYNVIFAARVRSPLDLAALRNALQVVSDRHSSLRTTFEDRQGQPVQVVRRQVKVAFPEIDASAWGEDRLYQEVSSAAYQPFDLTTGPLFRGAVFTRTEDDHVLLFAVHHVIADFWSLVVLMSEVRQIYQVGGGHHVPMVGDIGLPPLRVDYADYVRWQEELLAGPDGQRLWDYWRGRLGDDLPLLNLPTDRPYPAIQTDRGAAVNFLCEGPLAEGIRGLAARKASRCLPCSWPPTRCFSIGTAGRTTSSSARLWPAAVSPVSRTWWGIC